MNGITKINIRALFLALLLLFLLLPKAPRGTRNIPPEESVEIRLTADTDKIAVFANGEYANCVGWALFR